MKSLNALRKEAAEIGSQEPAGPVKELALICEDLAQQIEGLQRQLDEMRRQDTRRRAGM